MIDITSAGVNIDLEESYTIEKYVYYSDVAIGTPIDSRRLKL